MVDSRLLRRDHLVASDTAFEFVLSIKDIFDWWETYVQAL